MAEGKRQLDFFEETPARQGYGKLDAAVDGLRDRYGQNVVSPAAMMALRDKPVHARDAAPERHGALVRGESALRRLAIPRLTLGNGV